MKGMAMIHVPQMRDFVRDDRPAHHLWRHDEPPAQPDRTARRTAAPSPPRIADGKARFRNIGTAAIFAQIGAETPARLRFQPGLYPARHIYLRPADDDPVGIKPRLSRGVMTPDYPVLTAQKGNGFSHRNGPGPGRFGKLSGQPINLVGKKGDGTAPGITRRHRQRHRLPDRIDAQLHRSRMPVAPQADVIALPVANQRDRITVNVNRKRRRHALRADPPRPPISPCPVPNGPFHGSSHDCR